MRKWYKLLILFLILFFLSSDINNIYLYNEDNLDIARITYNNDEIVGWLEIPGLFITYVVQHSDNIYYLNHGIDRQVDIRGVPFIDYRYKNNGNQINIYGHNSSVFRLPFKELERYLDYNFYMNNNIIYLYINDTLRMYEIMFIKEEKNSIEHIKYSLNMKEHIDKLIDNSIYSRKIYYDNKSELLILQTCSMMDSYYIIGALRV